MVVVVGARRGVEIVFKDHFGPPGVSPRGSWTLGDDKKQARPRLDWETGVRPPDAIGTHLDARLPTRVEHEDTRALTRGATRPTLDAIAWRGALVKVVDRG